MPNEITEAVLQRRLYTVLEPYLSGHSESQLESALDAAWSAGAFSEFVGSIGRAVEEERIRAAGIARRLGHSQTAAIILRGVSDV